MEEGIKRSACGGEELRAAWCGDSPFCCDLGGCLGLGCTCWILPELLPIPLTLQPFWPLGTGVARGFLAAFDAAWMVKRWAEGAEPLEVLAER